jgi:dephospho-CoA kinase
VTRVWGLTGGIASGKSLAARFFAEAGIPVIDADQISRELSQPGGAAQSAIQKRFGTTDRTELRKLVFADPAARRDLESILHPLIKLESLNRIKKLGAPAVVYEAALLVEGGRYKELDGLIVVTSPLAQRRARLIARDGIAPELADQMIAAQLSDADRTKVANHVLENNGTEDDLRAKVTDLAKRL